MRKLRVPIDRMEVLFEKVKNKRFRTGRQRNWEVKGNGSVKAQNIMWLFCWACNGDNDWKAMVTCRDIFYEIFDFNLCTFLREVGYRFSNHYRYHDSDGESDLDELLNKSCQNCGSDNIFNLNYGLNTPSEDYEKISSFETADPLLVIPSKCHWRCDDCGNEF